MARMAEFSSSDLLTRRFSGAASLVEPMMLFSWFPWLNDAQDVVSELKSSSSRCLSILPGLDFESPATDPIPLHLNRTPFLFNLP